jgi:RNA polymerase sigma-70 factor (ECF subfamily)
MSTRQAAAAAHGDPPEAGAVESRDRRLDADSRLWLARLSGARAERDEALSELHDLLLGAARYALARRGSQLGREVKAEVATEAADDALMSILARLDDYRGESRFTTWAWKFAFYEACVAIRRRRWLGREIPSDADGWDAIAHEAAPDGRAEQRELLAALKGAVEQALTPHQRTVFVALALNEVPVDVLAERLGTNRGAVYKTLHDARARLRAALAAQGLGPDAA